MESKLPSVKEMVKESCENTGLDFEKLWNGERENSFSLSFVMTDGEIRMADLHPETTKDRKKQWELLSIVFQKYMDSYPAASVFKQTLYENLMECLQFIVDTYALVSADKLSNALEVPVKEDSTAALLKALHCQAGLTANQLAEELRKSRPAVINDLNRLGSPKKDPLRYAGQIVTAEVEKNTAGKPYRYWTPNTIHPVSMLLNVTQTGELLNSLYHSYVDRGVSICRGIALNVWLQLSEYGRERIRKVFGQRDEEFGDFLKELQEEAENGIRIAEYLSELEMIQSGDWDINCKEQFEIAVKGGFHCRIKLKNHREWIDGNQIQMRSPTKFAVHLGDVIQEFYADDVLQFEPIDD